MKKILLSMLAAVFVVPVLAAEKPAVAAKGKAPGARPYVDKMLQVPEVKAAQEKVWDARLALYAAQHERALLGIKHHKAEVEKNNPKNKAQMLKRLDEQKVMADKTLDQKKRLVAAERAQDWEKVRSIRQEMMKTRMGNRPMMKGGRPGMKGGAAGPGMGQEQGPMMGTWGDENEE